MKGILLAGGTGSRLFPVTSACSKQLLPVYDKPMIYYPLSILMLSGISEILIISTPEDLPKFQKLLGNGSHIGLQLSYVIQNKPNGIAEAFIIGESFIAGDSVALILGDNIFYGEYLYKTLSSCSKLQEGALIFGYEVNDPGRYGVIDFDDDCRVKDIIEKPKNPPSNYAVTGLYFYDSKASKFAKVLKPSNRGELEITDLNRLYLEEGKLKVKLLGRGCAWLDTGEPEALFQAASFVQTIQERQGLKIACIEEIAYIKGLISLDQLLILAEKLSKSSYGKYLMKIISNQKIMVKTC